MRPDREGGVAQKQPKERQAWQARLAAVCAVGLVGWIVYDAIGQGLCGSRPWPGSVVDYRILYEQSRRVIREGQYSGDVIFPYPPSAVVLLALTAGLSFPVAAAVWLAGTVAATLLTLGVGTSLVGLGGRPWRWPAALAAFAVASYFVEWDLRSQNCNMIYCALLAGSLASLRGGRDAAAGVLLAASVALKLYSVLLIPYLWWTGRWRALGAALGGLVVFFGVLPLLAWGPFVLVSVYASYAAHLRSVLGNAHAAWHPISIALPLALTQRLGPHSPLVPVLLRCASVLWFAAAAGCLLTGRPRRQRGTSGWDLAADGGVLALVPTVLSPYLEPYHGVPALLLTLALAARAADPDCRAAARSFAAAGLALGWLALRLSGAVGWRGVGVWAQMVTFALVLAAVRHLEGKALPRARPVGAEKSHPVAA